MDSPPTPGPDILVDTSDVCCCCRRKDCPVTRQYNSTILELEQTLAKAGEYGTLMIKLHERSAQSAALQLKQKEEQVRQYRQQNAQLETRLLELESDLDILNTRYVEMCSLLEANQAEIHRLTHHETRVRDLEKLLDAMETDYHEVCSRLEQSRESEKHADQLRREVSRQKDTLEELLDRLQQECAEERKRYATMTESSKKRIQALEEGKPNGRTRHLGPIGTLGLSTSAFECVQELIADNNFLKRRISSLRKALDESRQLIQTLREPTASTPLADHSEPAQSTLRAELTLNQPASSDPQFETQDQDRCNCTSRDSHPVQHNRPLSSHSGRPFSQTSEYHSSASEGSAGSPLPNDQASVFTSPTSASWPCNSSRLDDWAGGKCSETEFPTRNLASEIDNNIVSHALSGSFSSVPTPEELSPFTRFGESRSSMGSPSWNSPPPQFTLAVAKPRSGAPGKHRRDLSFLTPFPGLTSRYSLSAAPVSSPVVGPVGVSVRKMPSFSQVPTSPSVPGIKPVAPVRAEVITTPAAAEFIDPRDGGQTGSAALSLILQESRSDTPANPGKIGTLRRMGRIFDNIRSASESRKRVNPSCPVKSITSNPQSTLHSEASTSASVGSSSHVQQPALETEPQSASLGQRREEAQAEGDVVHTVLNLDVPAEHTNAPCKAIPGSLGLIVRSFSLRAPTKSSINKSPEPSPIAPTSHSTLDPRHSLDVPARISPRVSVKRRQSRGRPRPAGVNQEGWLPGLFSGSKSQSKLSIGAFQAEASDPSTIPITATTNPGETHGSSDVERVKSIEDMMAQARELNHRMAQARQSPAVSQSSEFTRATMAATTPPWRSTASVIQSHVGSEALADSLNEPISQANRTSIQAQKCSDNTQLTAQPS